MARNKEDLAIRFWRLVDKRGENDCWPWLGTANSGGYGVFRTAPNRNTTASRTAWKLVNGDIPKGLVICHSCDNPPCCNPAHLFAGTYADNTADCIAKGRICRGVGSHKWAPRHVKLTDDNVREIRRLRADGGDLYKIALRFGIGLTTVHNIATGKRKAHVV